MNLAELLPHVDNPMHEDRWGYGCFIADRAGISRRAISQKLVALERAGLVEWKTATGAPRAPRLWRRREPS